MFFWWGSDLLFNKVCPFKVLLLSLSFIIMNASCYMWLIQPYFYTFPSVIINTFDESYTFTDISSDDLIVKIKSFKDIDTTLEFHVFGESITAKAQLEGDIDEAMKFFQLTRQYFDPIIGNNNRESSIKVNIEYRVKQESIEQILQKLDGFKIPPQDAYYEIQGDSIVVFEGLDGYKVDIEAVEQILKSPISSKDIIAPEMLVHPNITKEAILDAGPYTLMSSYSTKFDHNNRNRTHNLTLASKNINGTLLKPGDVFSFNDTVGPRAVETGFLNAMIVMGSEFVPGIGGGICQVSSTLYKTALLANLEIIERRNHGLAITYMPLGMDATVSWGSIDFKFKNNTNVNILISSQVEHDTLSIKFFGEDPPDVNYESTILQVIEPRTISRYDSNIPLGQRIINSSGQRGYHVETFKIFEGQRTSIGTSYYRPMNRVVTIGTKED